MNTIQLKLFHSALSMSIRQKYCLLEENEIELQVIKLIFWNLKAAVEWSLQVANWVISPNGHFCKFAHRLGYNGFKFFYFLTGKTRQIMHAKHTKNLQLRSTVVVAHFFDYCAKWEERNKTGYRAHRLRLKGHHWIQPRMTKRLTLILYLPENHCSFHFSIEHILPFTVVCTIYLSFWVVQTNLVDIVQYWDFERLNSRS